MNEDAHPDALPRQLVLAQKHQRVRQGLQVVPRHRRAPQVRVQAGIPRGAPATRRQSLRQLKFRVCKTVMRAR